MTPTILLAAALTVTQVPAPTTALTPADAPPTDPTPRRTHLLRRAEILGWTGAAALILGAGFLTYSIASMAGGSQKAERYNALVDEVNLVPRPLLADERAHLDRIYRDGKAENRNAILCGVTAGVFTVIGAALLGRARVLRRSARDIGPLVLPRGLGVGWRVQF
jgi:hypothetical protein